LRALLAAASYYLFALLVYDALDGLCIEFPAAAGSYEG